MRLRPPTVEDIAAVLAVLTSCDLAELGEHDWTLDDLRHVWGRSEFDLGRNAIVAETPDDGVVGYGHVDHHGALGQVAPELRGRGIGTLILDWLQERAIELGRDRHGQRISAGNHAARALLTGAGYAYARSYLRMERPLDAGRPAATPPPGLALRALDPGADARALHALDAAAFAANADYHPESFELFCEDHIHAADIDRELSYVALRDGEYAGFLVTLRQLEYDGLAYVDLLAVHPEHRRRGVGTALLARAFGDYAAAGLSAAQLDVASDNPAAVALYARAGMRERFRRDIYERPVEPSNPGRAPT